MQKKWPILCGLAGLGLYGAHALLQHMLGTIPGWGNDLMMVVSIPLMMIGIAYSGVVLGRAFKEDHTDSRQ